MKELAELRDREAIQDVLYRHAHAINRFDAQLLAMVYWPDAIEDHSTYVGSRDDYIAWFMRARPSIPSHSHRLGNILIRLEGTHARVQSYFYGVHRWQPAGTPAEEFVIGGRFLDRMERRDREWRIAHRQVVYDTLREYTSAGDWVESRYLNKMNVIGAHAPQDPSCELFGDRLLQPF